MREAEFRTELWVGDVKVLWITSHTFSREQELAMESLGENPDGVEVRVYKVVRSQVDVPVTAARRDPAAKGPWLKWW